MKHIVLLGDRNPAYLTHRALDAAIGLFPPTVRARWVPTNSPDALRTPEADGVWIAPGSPYRNDDAVYAAITHARTSGQPFLGTCAGFQYTVIEFARNVAGIRDAAHAETAGAGSLVVDRLSCSLTGQQRVVRTVAGTRMRAFCGDTLFAAFHMCSFGLASAYVDALTACGLVVSAWAEDAGPEAVELPQHPFFIATLFQPQVRPDDDGTLHPVIRAFVSAVAGAGLAV